MNPVQEIVYPILWLLLFPGLVFAGVMGLVITWVDRKVTARVQYRVGPPWYQPFADVVKLLGKETIVPAGASRLAFFGAPLVAISAAALISAMTWVAFIWPQRGFSGDIFVLLYLLVLPSLALVLGGAAARNPLAAVGASREMKLILAYELPFVLALASVIVKAGNAIRLGDIFAAQETWPFLGSISGVLALVVLFLVTQAKLGLVPFDQAEAETEIMGGALIEYSGAALAAFKLAKAMLYFTLPVFVTFLLMGGVQTRFDGVLYVDTLKIIWRIVAVLLLVVGIVVVRNTNPRVRIETAVRFFWGPVSFLAVAAAALAAIGKTYGIWWL